VNDPRVLVDAATRDDAAVFRISQDRALVATVDFFAPVVDDPYAFGAIAAANAFSDLYAIGATPLIALNIVAWPRKPEVFELLSEVIRGGADVAKEAGALILGGHSIDDPEPKYGMVAIGEAKPADIFTNAGARAGDSLVLTKPIGTGILTTALKRDLASEPDIAEAVSSMRTLNRSAFDALSGLRGAVHALTDITGFGLLGHLRNMVAASKCGARLSLRRIPVFHGTRELVARGAVPGGTTRNREATNRYTRWAPRVDETDQILLNDAQTSGGHLIAIDSSRRDDLVRRLQKIGGPVTAAVVGEITAGPEGMIEVQD